MPEKQSQSSNRIRETLGRLYEHQPPHFREYMRRYQEDPTSRVFAPLAESYRRLGRLDEAIDICLEGLKHHPDFPGGRVALARCFFDKRKYNKAREELEIVVGISPDNILAQRLLGDCFFNLKERQKALQCYKITSILSPEDVGLQDKIHRLELDLKRGEYEEESIPVLPETSPEPLIKAESESTPTRRLNPEKITLSEDLLAEPLAEISVDEESEVGLAQTPSETLQQIDSFDNEKAGELGLEAWEETETLREDPEEADLRRAKIDSILGFEEDKGDSFKTENVSRVFSEETQPTSEITTQTLGELYYAQGQFEKSLKIFEKLHRIRPSSELTHKIQQCRAQMGVDETSLKRQQKIDLLNSILEKNRKND
jgi:tetratricopeptide (TPR) repeat protein